MPLKKGMEVSSFWGCSCCCLIWGSRALHSSMQCAAAMHPSLKELAVKVAKTKKKEHKPKFSLNRAWPESLCNSLEPQIKQQQEQAQKLETSILFSNEVCSISSSQIHRQATTQAAC